jgi:hypothetical protein
VDIDGVQYASKLYGLEHMTGAAEEDGSDEDHGDIEAAIRKETSDIRSSMAESLFKSVRLDTQCCQWS